MLRKGFEEKETNFSVLCDFDDSSYHDDGTSTFNLNPEISEEFDLKIENQSVDNISINTLPTFLSQKSEKEEVEHDMATTMTQKESFVKEDTFITPSDNISISEGVLIPSQTICSNCEKENFSFKIAPCLHLLCEGCSEDQESCPKCFTPISKDNLKTILLGDPICDECGILAVVECKLCGYYCKSCIEKHDRIPRRKLHERKQFNISIDKSELVESKAATKFTELLDKMEEISVVLLGKEDRIIKNKMILTETIHQSYDNFFKKLQEEKLNSLKQLNDISLKNTKKIKKEQQSVEIIKKSIIDLNKIYEKFKNFEHLNDEKEDILNRFESYLKNFKYEIDISSNFYFSPKYLHNMNISSLYPVLELKDKKLQIPGLMNQKKKTPETPSFGTAFSFVNEKISFDFEFVGSTKVEKNTSHQPRKKKVSFEIEKQRENIE